MNNTMMNRLGDTLEGSLMQQNDNANVGKSERMVSLGTGAFIALKGITNIFSHPLIALTELGVGGTLLYRAVTGYCPIKESFENKGMNVEMNNQNMTSNQSNVTDSITTESEISNMNMGDTGSLGNMGTSSADRINPSTSY